MIKKTSSWLLDEHAIPVRKEPVALCDRLLHLLHGYYLVVHRLPTPKDQLTNLASRLTNLDYSLKESVVWSLSILDSVVCGVRKPGQGERAAS